MTATVAIDGLNRSDEAMTESNATGVVTIDYAKEQDAVLIEYHPLHGGMSKDMFPAKVVEMPNGYEIIPVGRPYGFRVSKESYGKTWRCWEIKKPSMIDRISVAWV